MVRRSNHTRQGTGRRWANDPADRARLADQLGTVPDVDLGDNAAKAAGGGWGVAAERER